MKIFDITKSVAMLTVVGMLWYYGSSFVEKFNKPSIPAAVLTAIDNNAVKLAELTASNEAVKELRKEFEIENSKILAAYEEQKSKTKEALDELGKIKGKQKQTVDLVNRRSDKSVTNKKNDKLSYEFKKIYSKDADGKPLLTGWAMYYPNQSADKLWKTGTYPLEHYTTIIETENVDGTFNRYAEMYLENNQMKETKGKKFPIKLEVIDWAKIERKEKSWSFWNPRLGVGMTAIPGRIAPVIDLSTMSYGRTHRDLDFRFLTFGFGADISPDDNLVLMGSFEPFSWNIGNFLPLVENMFTGPVVVGDTEGTITYGVKIAIPF